MKLLGIILDVIVACAIIIALVVAGAFIYHSTHMNTMDKLGYYYATEIMGESGTEYLIGSFIDEVNEMIG